MTVSGDLYYVLAVSMLPLSTILIFDFPTVVHFNTGQRYHLSYPWKPV